MVKVIGRSKDEIERYERISKLVKIAQEVLPELEIDDGDMHPFTLFSVRRRKSPLDPIYSFLVFPLRNEIEVYNPKILDAAIDLAHEYEKRGEIFTVKKDYDETPAKTSVSA